MIKIIPEQFLDQYKLFFPKGVKEKFETLHDADISNDSFSFYTSVTAVFSNKNEYYSRIPRLFNNKFPLALNLVKELAET